MKRFVRGTTIDFTTTFYDKDGNQAQPDTATLTISYPPSGWPLNGRNREKAEIAMEFNSETGKWTAKWHSAPSAPGIVFYHMRSSDPNLTTEDGRFQITGNLANLEVEAE